VSFRPAPVLALALLASASTVQAGPRVDYMLHCQGCHLPDGSGTPGRVPALRGQVARFLQVEGGRAYLVRVPGSAFSALDDARLAAVLNWMVAEFGPSESARGFRGYTAAEVAPLRADALVDVDAERARLLKNLPD